MSDCPFSVLALFNSRACGDVSAYWYVEICHGSQAQCTCPYMWFAPRTSHPAGWLLISRPSSSLSFSSRPFPPLEALVSVAWLWSPRISRWAGWSSWEELCVSCRPRSEQGEQGERVSGSPRWTERNIIASGDQVPWYHFV